MSEYPGYRESQSAHTNEVRAVRIIQKTFGGSRSQLRNLLRLEQAQRNQVINPNEGNHTAQLFQEPPRIRRSEVITQEIQHVGQPAPQELLIVPPGVVPGGSTGIEECPGDTIYYGRIRTSPATIGDWRAVCEDIGTSGKVYARKELAWYDITGFLVLSVTATADSTLYTNPPVVTVDLDPATGLLTFEFIIPAGEPGAPGMDGSDPTDEHLNELILAILDPSAFAYNPITVDTLGMTVSNPPTQAEVQTIADKLDELIEALKH